MGAESYNILKSMKAEMTKSCNTSLQQKLNVLKYELLTSVEVRGSS